jgi:surfeit locus 1 family protein
VSRLNVGARWGRVAGFAGTFAVFAVAMLGVRLGVWQLDRAQEKRDLQTRFEERAALPVLGAKTLASTNGDAAAQYHRIAELEGAWDATHTVLLDNRPMDGRAGFYVLTPLLLRDSADAVLVQRGWAPRDVRDPSKLPDFRTPTGSVVVRGRLAPPPSHRIALGHEGAGPIRQNLALSELAQSSGLKLLPVILVQLESSPVSSADPSAQDGLLRHWPPASFGIDKHYGYAFQWFALAATLIALYVWNQFFRARKSNNA